MASSVISISRLDGSQTDDAMTHYVAIVEDAGAEKAVGIWFPIFPAVFRPAMMSTTRCAMPMRLWLFMPRRRRRKAALCQSLEAFRHRGPTGRHPRSAGSPRGAGGTEYPNGPRGRIGAKKMKKTKAKPALRMTSA